MCNLQKLIELIQNLLALEPILLNLDWAVDWEFCFHACFCNFTAQF